MANVINSLKLGDGTYVFTTPYATCDTAAATAAKVATITPGSNFSLETGARVAVKFANANTAGSPTLNVNNTGAKPIYFKNVALSSSNYWSAGQIIDFIYDGTNWVCSAVVTDTKNTAGATDTASMIYLIGATSQGSNPQTYSHDTVYVGTDGCLYSNHSKVATLEDNNTFTGSNTFTKTVKLGDMNAYTGNAVSTYGAIEFYNGVFDCGKLVTDSPDDKNLTYKYNDAVVKFPKKTGTLALTSDIPSTNSFVTIANEQTITGKKTFNGGVQFGTNTVFNNGGIQIPAANAFKVMGMYDVSLPSKSGTLATTGDIPSTSSFATLSGNNTFTGITSFTNTVSCGTIISNSGFTATSASNSSDLSSLQYNCITRTTNSTSYTLTLPTKSGTIALTSDIPSGGGSGDVTAAGNNTFTGNNKFQGGTTSFTTASPRPGASVTTVDADGVLCQTDGDTGTYYQDNQIQHQGFSLGLPYKSGTLATTSDFPIKSATLSGTTLSITLS